MMLPEPASFMGRAAVCMPRKTPVWLMATMVSQRSREVFSMSTTSKMPALFTSTSRRPWSAMT